MSDITGRCQPNAASSKIKMTSRGTVHYVFSDRVRLFEMMVFSLIVLIVIGIMLSAFATALVRAQDAARRYTARTLYMAVQDYTVHQLDAGVDMKKLENLNENSTFLQKYVSGPIKGRLKVYLTEQGVVKSIEYTENGKTVILP
ncbi:type II secretion system protein [Acetanaerobacterium elongatum]|nr:type II secretion system protein [Acetanaerobacterium elongatum]